MEIILFFLIVVFVLLYSSFSWGYVAHTMYLWFIHPHFVDLPTFSVIQFIGFMMFANIITNRGQNHIKEEYKDTVSMYTYLFLGPWVTLACAWLLKSILM